MRIFVINLEHEHERRINMSNQLNAQGLLYEFVSGIDGRKMSISDINLHYNDRQAVLYRSRSLVRSEIGIALSHLKVYNTIIQESIELALVLEDDVVLTEDFFDFISVYEKKIFTKDPTLCLLSPSTVGLKIVNGDLKTRLRKYELFQFEKGVYASSYIINFEGAKVLSRELYPVSDVADCWSRIKRYNIIAITVAIPSLTYQNQHIFGSSTTKEISLSGYLSGFQFYKYKIRRIFSVIYQIFDTFFHKINK